MITVADIRKAICSRLRGQESNILQGKIFPRAGTMRKLLIVDKGRP